MGQALRKVTGRIGSSASASAPTTKRPPLRQPPPPNVAPAAESLPKPDGEVVPEEKDLQYNAMLSQLVGKVQTRRGGGSEMGEGMVVKKNDRPLPKARNTTVESSRYEDRPAPPGKLNVKQIRHMMLLYEGKADDHDGRMDIAEIATRFRIDASQVQRIVQSASLMPEDKKDTTQ